MNVELVVDAKDSLGEGLFYDIETNKLWWNDIVGPPAKLHCLDLTNNEEQIWDMPEMISYPVVKESGGLLIASHGGLKSFDPSEGKLKHIKQIETDKPFNRSNDGCCDAKGNLWIGTMQNNIAPNKDPIKIIGASGGLYRVDKDYNITTKVTDISISNSLCFSPDSKKMYFCDTLQDVIWVYDLDIDSGEISNRQDFARFERGGPDGATIDAEGCLWSTRYGGSCVVRFTPEGKVDTVVNLPASQITCCTFGGKDLDTLFITTARIDLKDDQLTEEPLAGGLFMIKPGVKGIPDCKFAG